MTISQTTSIHYLRPFHRRDRTRQFRDLPTADYCPKGQWILRIPLLHFTGSLKFRMKQRKWGPLLGIKRESVMRQVLCKVEKAFAAQLFWDLNLFFGARSVQMASGGLTVVLLPFRPDGVLISDSMAIHLLECLGDAVADMVNEVMMKIDYIIFGVELLWIRMLNNVYNRS